MGSPLVLEDWGLKIRFLEFFLEFSAFWQKIWALGKFFQMLFYLLYFLVENFQQQKNNFLSIYFLPKSSSWLKIAIMEYRIDLKASEAVQAYTLQKANAAKTKHCSRRRTHHKIQK